MNKITIKKVAIIGSGIMGSRIACHFANIGVKVLLLDICSKELSEEEKKKGLNLKDKIVRNRIVNNSFFNTLKTKPKSFYLDENKKNISLGNIEDDINKISKVDWVIEVVVEKLKIKKMAKALVLAWLRKHPPTPILSRHDITKTVAKY